MLLLALPVQAEPPISSLRPLPRPEAKAELTAPAPPATSPEAVPTLRPEPRPVTAPAAVAAVPPQAAAQPEAQILRMSALRPQPRPAELAARAAESGVTANPAPEPAGVSASVSEPKSMPQPRPKSEAKAEKRRKASRKGSVCGDAAIRGEEIARITSGNAGCGIAEPVRITSVSGVRLSQPATLDCDTARALNRWVDTGLQPAFGRTKVVELRVAAHYICRSRNNIKGAKVSEHGRGKAIDIAAVVLETGKTVSVLGGFGKELRRAYKAACGTFGTTLGPGSDGFHEDHMHFDTASHRSGPYCR